MHTLSLKEILNSNFKPQDSIPASISYDASNRHIAKCMNSLSMILKTIAYE